MPSWLRLLVAFVVACHGFIYVRIGSVLPGPIRGWRGRSALLGSALSSDQLKTLVVALHVTAGIAIIASAAAIAAAPSAAGWWRPLAVIGSALGIAAFAVFWDGQTRLLADEGLIGAIVSLTLLGVAVVFPRAFG